jgi:glycosyltransferase involved in cell wall biosynthesis
VASKTKRLDGTRAHRHLAQVPHHNQRYAFVTTGDLDPRRGGPSDAALTDLLTALNRRGKHIALVSPPRLPLPDRVAGRWFNWRVRRVLARLDADCIVGVEGDGYRFARAPRKQRYVALLYGVKADEMASAKGRTRRRLAVEARWEARAAQAADLVITASHYAQRRAISLYRLPAGRVAVVPCTIDLDRWRLQPASEADAHRVLCAAELTHRNGMDTLLEAWALVRARHSDATLRIVGNGPLRQDLQRRAQSLFGSGTAVRFRASQPVQELIREYAACHLFCLACRQEALGLPFLEAMATGRPVIGTRVGAVPEVVGEAGWLVPPDDPKALADALLRLLASLALRKQKAAQAVARASEFAAQAAAARFGELLAGL